MPLYFSAGKVAPQAGIATVTATELPADRTAPDRAQCTKCLRAPRRSGEAFHRVHRLRKLRSRRKRDAPSFLLQIPAVTSADSATSNLRKPGRGRRGAGSSPTSLFEIRRPSRVLRKCISFARARRAAASAPSTRLVQRVPRRASALDSPDCAGAARAVSH